MNMNFDLAFEKLGVPLANRETIFRFDDTNPEAESNEYIQSLREDVAWLGWKPCQVTHTSDYFQKLYELAVELIKRDKAYVCHQSKLEIEASREVCKAKTADPNAPGDPNSPYRNRPIAESLKEFENMKKGKYAANQATLRLKMDMLSPNPNMWDQVAYRIKYLAHPHAGDAWCIYPTYDYTHCIIDSLEHIDYSICTLEFETRRESYFWVLEALDMYRPKVYEMSRLNISYTVLSKRKLLKLVVNGFMRGWDDPRMPTIKGLRRRGYTPGILNAFCRDIGATRNMNVVQYERLNAVARAQLHETSPRVMVVLQPLRVEITGRDFSDSSSGSNLITVPDYPFDPSRGSHTVPMQSAVFIDHSDFRLTHHSDSSSSDSSDSSASSSASSEDYFGLAVGKVVALKYAFRIRCESVELDALTGLPVLLRCVALPESERPEDKPKGSIQWVPCSGAVPVEARLYHPLFTAEEPSDLDWEQQLNPQSEEVRAQALADPSLLSHYHAQSALAPEQHFQFERLGFFVVDRDSDLVSAAGAVGGKGRIVFNMTVNLKDSKPKSASSASAAGPCKSRKEEQAKQLADKMARMSIAPEDMFRAQPELYSQFDSEGVPTHDAAGEKISKSGSKKLKKDWEKQKKLFESSGGAAASTGAAASEEA